MDKAGLCIICSCTNPPNLEPIPNCTAPDRMVQCFGTELGYVTHIIGPNMSSHDLNNLLQALSELSIPDDCSKDFRFLLSFFGHGNEKEICLSDGNFKRSSIIVELQKMSRALFKIILFDSCRTESPSVKMSRPIQETQMFGGMPAGKTQWESKSYYPHAECVNTLVIYATDFNCKAYYTTVDGCGLVTHFFTTLASSSNRSLPVVLENVRKEVDKIIKDHEPEITSLAGNSPPFQVLIYEDRLMGDVNFLAESKGNGNYILYIYVYQYTMQQGKEHVCVPA